MALGQLARETFHVSGSDPKTVHARIHFKLKAHPASEQSRFAAARSNACSCSQAMNDGSQFMLQQTSLFA